jgi:hypothetical protein
MYAEGISESTLIKHHPGAAAKGHKSMLATRAIGIG